MKLNSNIYFGFDVVFYFVMGISGFVTSSQMIHLFALPPSSHKHPEITSFVHSFTILYANVLGVVNLTQSFSFFIALLGNDETKRTVSKINAFLNVLLVACFWYNIKYINNPLDDFKEHLLFVEQGIAGIMFSNMWAVADSVFLLYFGVFQKSGKSTTTTTTNVTTTAEKHPEIKEKPKNKRK